MTLQEFIDAHEPLVLVDGYGRIVTDDDLIAERLIELGIGPRDTLNVEETKTFSKVLGRPDLDRVLFLPPERN